MLINLETSISYNKMATLMYILLQMIYLQCDSDTPP